MTRSGRSMRVRRRRQEIVPAAIFLALALVLGAPLAAGAAVFSCGAGSLPTPVQCLIDAMGAANGNGEPNTIQLDGSTFTLTAAHNTVQGNGATIQRDAATLARFRILHVDVGGELTLIDVTVKNGRAPDFLLHGSAGGGIFNLGTLQLVGATISDNRAGDSGPWLPDQPEIGGTGGWGGGISTSGTATITGSTIRDNRAGDGIGKNVLGGAGGGIANGILYVMTGEGLVRLPGILHVVDSTIASNRAGAAGTILATGAPGGGGGGIDTDSGEVTITGSLIHDNVAGSGFRGGHGGGLQVYGTQVDITHTTFDQNHAGGFLDTTNFAGGSGGAIGLPLF